MFSPYQYIYLQIVYTLCMFTDCGFVVLQGTTYWTDLFVRHFLFQEEQSIDCDDLLFFVRKRHVKGSSRYLPKYEVSNTAVHSLLLFFLLLFLG